MGREKAFEKMMDIFFEVNSYAAVYEANTQRKYLDYELYMVEIYAIEQIAINKELNLTRLGKMVNRSKGTVSQMISKLKGLGLVYTITNPENASELFLKLTSEGSKVYKFHRKTQKGIYNILLDRMPDLTELDFKICFEVLSNLKQAASGS